MIGVNPSNRPTFDTLLHTSRGTVFPESFYSFLYNYVASLNELSSETLSTSAFHSQTGTPLPSAGFPSAGVGGVGVNHTVRNTSAALGLAGAEATANTADLLPSDSDHRVERIWADYESIEAYITPEASMSASVAAQEEAQTDTKTESTRKVEMEGLEGVKVEYIPVSGSGSRSGRAFQVCFFDLTLTFLS